MRRLVWIGAALLIMVGIFGYAMFTMRNIEQVNQRRREKDAGKDIVAQIVATTETTNIWEMLRSTETEAVSAETEQVTDDPNRMREAIIPHATESPEEESSEESTDSADSEATSEETDPTLIVIEP
ncbi:MAG: hypothetical protein IJ906_04685 [Oscillospiraceae bacterium]|nr:hypothetical protein [Oscillospiraceae bacterium]